MKSRIKKDLGLEPDEDSLTYAIASLIFSAIVFAVVLLALSWWFTF